MGIDVWVKRGAPRVAALPVQPVTSGVVNQAPAPAQVSKRTAEPPRATAVAPEASVAIQLECVSGPGAVLVGALSGAADLRLARDIVQAIAGPDAALQRTAFRWPQTQSGDTSPAGASSAYAGFLRGQTDRASARCLLLLGAAATELADSVELANGAAVLRCAAATSIRADFAAKKALWLAISKFAVP